MKDNNTKITIATYDSIYDKYIKDFENEETGNDFVNVFLSYFESDNNLILDAGCGSGNLSKLMVNNNQNVVGIDLSKNMINYAKNYVKEAKFYIRDIRNTKFEDSMFDGIIASRVLFHIPKENLFDSIKEFVRKNA